MLRVTLFAMFIGMGALLFAESKPTSIEPKPQAPVADRQPCNVPQVTSSQRACAPVDFDNLCVCAIYPVWADGSNILYYAEICTPSTACAVDDVAYYFAPEVAWPRNCRTTGTPGQCLDCDDAMLKARAEVGPFAGMATPVSKADSVRYKLFPEDIPYANATQHAHPRQGVKFEFGDGLYVSFKVFREPVYAKLFVVRVRADKGNVNAPIDDVKDRLLFVGYEVTDLTKPEMDNAIPVESQKAYRKTSSGTSQESDFVRKVTIGGNNFLVLLDDGQ